MKNIFHSIIERLMFPFRRKKEIQKMVDECLDAIKQKDYSISSSIGTPYNSGRVHLSNKETALVHRAQGNINLQYGRLLSSEDINILRNNACSYDFGNL